MLAGSDEAGCGVGILFYMNIELALLVASVILGIVHIIIVSHLQSWQRGYWWTASSREQSVAPLIGIAGRAERALRNYLETFPFFAAAILVVTVTNTHSWLTVWGAHFYFWGRIVYAILYTADLPLARSLVWNMPTIGILIEGAHGWPRSVRATSSPSTIWVRSRSSRWAAIRRNRTGFRA
jgi:uncharacterized MAPEG superfamily protein